MPAAFMEKSAGQDCVRDLCDNLEALRDVGAGDDELSFLRNFLEDPSLLNLVQAKDNIDRKREPKTSHAVEMTKEVMYVLENNGGGSRESEVLKKILEDSNVKAALMAHDEIASQRFGENDSYDNVFIPPLPAGAITEQIRYVIIKKDPNEPMGITVKLDESNDLVVARILSDSLIDRQGTLRVGDIIHAVNGYDVYTPEQLMNALKESDRDITLKIVPSYHDASNPEPKFLKSHYTYDPMSDRLLPCKDAGLPFNNGDVLEIINEDDPNWWQARLSDKADGPTGLIPSLALEEKRKAFVAPDYNYSKGSLLCGLTRKKKKKIKYNSKVNTEFDNCDLSIYEEVVRMAPFKRRILVLVGSHGVGRRALKERLIKDNPRQFGTCMPHTSRAPREGEKDGRGYYFVDRETMDADINANKYIEFGEFNGNLYGTKIEMIYEVIRTKRMCVLDINPTSLKVLKTPEFMSYIIFIAAPSVEVLKVMYQEGRKAQRSKLRRSDDYEEMRTEEDFIRTVQESIQIEQVYNSYFDDVIVNDSFEQTYTIIRRMLNDMTESQQWVPVNWVY